MIVYFHGMSITATTSGQRSDNNALYRALRNDAEMNPSVSGRDKRANNRTAKQLRIVTNGLGDRANGVRQGCFPSAARITRLV